MFPQGEYENYGTGMYSNLGSTNFYSPLQIARLDLASDEDMADINPMEARNQGSEAEDDDDVHESQKDAGPEFGMNPGFASILTQVVGRLRIDLKSRAVQHMNYLLKIFEHKMVQDRVLKAGQLLLLTQIWLNGECN
jgi:hypothetical protein